MCHQYLCADCAKVSWDFCTEASDFNCCPNFSQTTYQTDRRCHPCIVMTEAIEELGYWLARHPKRDVDYDGPELEEDSISVKSFTDSDDEDTDKKAVAKPDSPWGCQSGTTLDEEEIEVGINNKGKENVVPEGLESDDEDDEEYNQDETDDEEDFHSETSEDAPAAICKGW